MINLPKDDQHIAIVGRTGTGKSVAAIWHLLNRPFHLKPYVVYDYKHDVTINGISDAIHIGTDVVPREPGIYIVHPLPDDTESVQAQLWKIWERENIGVYIDEGYMVCSSDRPNPAFRALLTQGRSKRCDLIVLSQRPVWLDRFVFSESSFYQVFDLNDRLDRRRMEQFIPADLDKQLPKYHSYYYDVGENEIAVLKPVPKPSELLEGFRKRFEKMREKPPEPERAKRVFI